MLYNQDRSFSHFVTNHAFDRQTDGRTDRILIAIPRLHSMQRGEKLAIAMHCNLRPPDVASVVLRFNFEAHNTLRSHNAPTYQISTKSDDSRLRYFRVAESDNGS